MTCSQAAKKLPDPAFLALAAVWAGDQADILLGFVWAAFDRMRADMPKVDGRDLERSLTQLLEPRVRKEMSGFEPYYIQHGSFERETMAAPPAQPPAYDLAFVLNAEERIMWPLEAKVLETAQRTAGYEDDVKNQFLTCRYAPFSSAGAMLGYLLSGSPSDALSRIEKGLGCTFQTNNSFPHRPHRTSDHRRQVPIGKAYPTDFRCHHLILEFPGLQRFRKSR
jgi:hypothetical protein